VVMMLGPTFGETFTTITLMATWTSNGAKLAISMRVVGTLSWTALHLCSVDREREEWIGRDQTVTIGLFRLMV